MNRRTFHRVALGSSLTLASRFGKAAQAGTQYEPTWDSLKRHQPPQWYQDAKLGIFIHWGLYSVPAWAPTTGELGKVDWKTWFRNNPYAEWYLNSLRIKGSPTYEHHIKTYGADFDYYQFMPMFTKAHAQWDPASWADLFKKTHARYVVLTTKHHDGFTLWPSQTQNPKTPGKRYTSDRDLVGELTTAVRASGLKMGLYYSGGLDWTFTSEPIVDRETLMARVPQSEEYARYAGAHYGELIHKYQPAVLWNDINYPKAGKIPELFADYYNTVPDGVIDNRFGVDFSDFTTPEYAKYDKITEKKWEACRGLGFSFGYNKNEGPGVVIEPDKLVALLVDIVSKNGNLLLNIGPKADGTISDIQLDRLHKLGAWLDVNGEGLFETRPWVRAQATQGKPDVRFTQKGGSLYAFVLDRPADTSFAIPSLVATEGTEVQILGQSKPAKWQQDGPDLRVSAGEPLPGSFAVGVKITPAPKA
jgi:alpha-L-fucosidase